MKEVVVVSACRSPIGAFGGSLKPLQAPELAAQVMRETVKRGGVDPSMIGDVRFGNCLEPPKALNVARVSALLADIPWTVPAVTINRVCTSAMEAIVSGALQIQTGFTDVVLAGGVESMSNVPYCLEKARWGQRLFDGVLLDALTTGLHAGSHFYPHPETGKHYIMGETAEFLNEKYGFTREEQDEVALRSHNNAERATKNGDFKDEIVPIEVKGRKGDVKIVDKDEHFRPGLTAEDLAKLRPAFKKDGTVTAGNSSGINDGAAGVLIMSREKADELGLKPLARLVDYGMGCSEPHLMGESPIAAVKNLIERSGEGFADWDLVELNEAFASQYLAVERGLKDLGFDREKTNVNGSGIGLGHPVGCTGARIIVTLLHALKKRGLKRGMATLCGGGGVSIASVWEIV
ncbi:MAG: acetyl-CoA C-acyltransferase [Candidatus Thorarchaeota archaeon]|nr:MAG: acetyl-CoA C-acyltransferase [Candidatus Thorarchaeota archaeon]RLI59211.1 MAG: acetyl-CoA C-acyltransferase [Candidatus Thorarchaeota archaeon]